MELTHKTIEKIADKMDQWDHMEWALTYGEPGYGSVHTAGVLLGNWWLPKSERRGDDTERLQDMGGRWPRLFAALEEQGYELEWSDEWMVDYESGKAYRTTADSYSWQSSVVMTEGGDWLTPDSDSSEWLEWAINNPKVALPTGRVSDEYLTNDGFVKVDERFESGWYPGQDADPQAITDDIRDLMPGADVVFVLSDVGQFDVHFVAWVRGDEDEDDDTDY